MGEHSPSAPQVVGARLGGFKTGKYICAETVDHVGRVGLIFSDVAGEQVRVAVVFLTAVEIERQTRRGPNLQLRHAPGGMNRVGAISYKDNSLAQTSQHANVFTLEKRA